MYTGSYIIKIYNNETVGTSASGGKPPASVNPPENNLKGVEPYDTSITNWVSSSGPIGVTGITGSSNITNEINGKTVNQIIAEINSGTLSGKLEINLIFTASGNQYVEVRSIPHLRINLFEGATIKYVTDIVFPGEPPLTGNAAYCPNFPEVPCPSSLIPAGDGSEKFNGLSLIPWNECPSGLGSLCNNYGVDNLILDMTVHISLNTQESGNGGGGENGGGNTDTKSFWDKYKWWIIGGIIALVVIVIIIILIVVFTKK